MSASRRRGVPAAVWSGGYLSALNQLFSNTQPIVLGTLAVQFGLSGGLLGQFNAVFIAAGMLSTLSAPWWVRQFNLRLVSLIAIAGAGLSCLLGIGLTSTFGLFTLFALLGFFKGMLAPPAFLLMGDASDPNRGFAIGVMMQGLLAAFAILLLGTFVIPAAGATGMYIALSAIIATGFVVLPTTPKGTTGERQVEGSAGAPIFSGAAVPPIAVLIAIALFVAGILGYWTFVERIGAEHGVPLSMVGLAISLCALASVASSGAVAWIGERVPATISIITGTLVVLTSFGLLHLPGTLSFIVSNLLFALGWGLAQPSYWTIARNVDATNRLFVAAPAAAGVGGVASGLLAGPIIRWGGFGGMTMTSAAMLIAAAALAATVAAGTHFRGQKGS